MFKEVAIPRIGTEVGKKREVVKLTMLLLLTIFCLKCLNCSNIVFSYCLIKSYFRF